MACTAITASGRKCRKGPLCHVHKLQTCVVCLETVQTKDAKKLNCRHVFHPACITNWFVMSDECPVCRADQGDDPLIQFKKRIEDGIRATYQDAIQSLEEDVHRLRTRRPRSLFPRRLSYAGTVLSNNPPGSAV